MVSRTLNWLSYANENYTDVYGNRFTIPSQACEKWKYEVKLHNSKYININIYVYVYVCL